MTWIAYVVTALVSLLARGAIRPVATSVLALVGALLILIERGGMPTGYGPVAAIAASAAVVFVERLAFGPEAARRWFVAGLALLGAVLSAALPTPGVDTAPMLAPLGTPWTIAHVAVATLAFAGVVVAAVTAGWRLRGQAVILLPIAVLLTLLPLITGSALAHGHLPGSGALWLEVPIVDPAGGDGLIRTVPAAVALPFETWLRIAALVGVGLTTWLSIAAAAAGRPTLPRAIVWVGRLSAATVVLRLAVACLPIALGSDDVGPAVSALSRELVGSKAIGAFAAPTGLMGGPGAVTASLAVALIALGLVWLGTAAPANAEVDGASAAVEARLASLTTLLLALTALTGIAWSNYAWSGLLVPDPKLFATLAALGLYGLYHVMDGWLPSWRHAPSLMLVLAFLVLGWSMVGPELGWTAPSLHRFGG